jgi:hypothetical protein
MSSIIIIMLLVSWQQHDKHFEIATTHMPSLRPLVAAAHARSTETMPGLQIADLEQAAPQGGGC